MPEDHYDSADRDIADADGLPARLRIAIETADLEAFSELLDPHVTWGPPRGGAVCTNRDEVLTWYTRGRERRGRAEVAGITPIGNKLLVGLVVHGTDSAKERGGAALRWQVLTVRDGRIADIVGFDSKEDALANAMPR